MTRCLTCRGASGSCPRPIGRTSKVCSLFPPPFYGTCGWINDNITSLALWERVRVRGKATVAETPHPRPLPPGEGAWVKRIRMRGYIIRRILATIPVMAVVAIFVFSLLRLTPGDPAAVIAGDYATAQDIQRIRQKLGLDHPLHIQFGIWLGRLLQGDLGTSIFSGMPVSALIAQRLEPTLALTVLATLIAIVTAIPLGVLAAWKTGAWVDRAVMILAVLGFSLPTFWLGFLLMYSFAIRLPMLPVQGYVRLSDGFLPFLKHIILPALTLGLVYMALIARMTRASLLEVLQEDYIRTAHAKGTKPSAVLLRHALK